jgi:hypothetical protein
VLRRGAGGESHPQRPWPTRTRGLGPAAAVEAARELGPAPEVALDDVPDAEDPPAAVSGAP